jgi:hypothetical protein
LPSVPFILRVPAPCKQTVSHTTRNLLASVGIHLYTGLACYGALEIHHGTADFVANRWLALLHSSGSSSGACGAMTGRVSRTRSSCSAGASCCASMMAGVVPGTDFLFGRRCRVTTSEWVARVLGRGRDCAVVALQAIEKRGLAGGSCVC